MEAVSIAWSRDERIGAALACADVMEALAILFPENDVYAQHGQRQLIQSPKDEAETPPLPYLMSSDVRSQ